MAAESGHCFQPEPLLQETVQQRDIREGSITYIRLSKSLDNASKILSIERSGGSRCGEGGSLLSWTEMDWRLVAGEEEREEITLQVERKKICEKVTSWKFSLQNQVRQAPFNIFISDQFYRHETVQTSESYFVN